MGFPPNSVNVTGALTKQLPGLDCIRFAAACLVMIFHLSYWCVVWPGAPTNTLLTGIQPAEWAWFGWVGVEIFFVLSGFVIAFSASQSSPGLFLRSRILRLAPAAWICATLCASLLLTTRLAAPSDVMPAWLRTILFWPQGPWVDDVFWTLGVEISFYGLVLITSFLAPNRLRELAWGLAALSFVYWVAAAIWDLHRVVLGRIADLLLLKHGGFFAVGMMLFSWQKSPVSKNDILFFSAAVLACLAEIGAVTESKTDALPGEFNVFVPWMIWFLATFFIWISAESATLNRLLYRFKGHLRSAGHATYPLYLLHTLVGSVIIHSLPLSTPSSLKVAIGAVCSIVIAFLVAAFPEPLIRTQLKRLLVHCEEYIQEKTTIIRKDRI